MGIADRTVRRQQRYSGLLTSPKGKIYARTPFDGEGAYGYGGRWSSAGIRLSYTSEHQSLAMLEYFVHLDKDDPPTDLVLTVAEVPDDQTAPPNEYVFLSHRTTIWRRTRFGRLKNRGEAVFVGHRFYDFHASVARIDLFAGSNHSRSL